MIVVETKDYVERPSEER